MAPFLADATHADTHQPNAPSLAQPPARRWCLRRTMWRPACPPPQGWRMSRGRRPRGGRAPQGAGRAWTGRAGSAQGDHLHMHIWRPTTRTARRASEGGGGRGRTHAQTQRDRAEGKRSTLSRLSSEGGTAQTKKGQCSEAPTPHRQTRKAGGGGREATPCADSWGAACRTNNDTSHTLPTPVSPQRTLFVNGWRVHSGAGNVPKPAGGGSPRRTWRQWRTRLHGRARPRKHTLPSQHCQRGQWHVAKGARGAPEARPHNRAEAQQGCTAQRLPRPRCRQRTHPTQTHTQAGGPLANALPALTTLHHLQVTTSQPSPPTTAPQLYLRSRP
jgi:hypothetical protein